MVQAQARLNGSPPLKAMLITRAHLMAGCVCNPEIKNGASDRLLVPCPKQGKQPSVYTPALECTGSWMRVH
jgi:hypothetical protein